MHRKKDTKTQAEKIAFIIYGNLDSSDNLKEKAIKWIAYNAIGASIMIDLDVIFSPLNPNYKNASVKNLSAKNDAITVSKAISDSIHRFNLIPNKKKYTTAILVNANFFNSPNVSRMDVVIDFSLPKNYLYLAYDEDIDFGYSIDYLWGSPTLISEIEDLSRVVTNSINGKNDFIKMFTATGWPSTVVTSNSSILISWLKINILSFLNNSVLKKILSHTGKYAVRKLEGLKRLIAYEILQSSRIAEIHGQQMNPPAHLTYNSNLVGDIRPAVKYFILEKGLRDRVRFLSVDDFNMTEPSVKLN